MKRELAQTAASDRSELESWSQFCQYWYQVGVWPGGCQKGMVARDPPTKPASELLLAPCSHGRQLNPMGNMWPPHRCSLMDGFAMEAALVPGWVKFMKTCRLGWPRVGGQGQGVNIECRQRLRCERWKKFPDVVRIAQQWECIVWQNHYNTV